VWQTWRANAKATEARLANQQLQEQLYGWRLDQVRNARTGGVEGRRALGMAAVSAAAAFRPSIELRNEAIASLALFDFEPRSSKVLPDQTTASSFDPALEHFVIGDENGNIHFRCWREARSCLGRLARLAKEDQPSTNCDTLRHLL
jgi:hypothetical protein